MFFFLRIQNHKSEDFIEAQSHTVQAQRSESDLYRWCLRKFTTWMSHKCNLSLYNRTEKLTLNHVEKA